ncbi:hypothetical protein HKD28_15120 [Gluconobacter sp. LMG 1744]|uniref:hypothetical protein n=1 Tax=Gluconobacter cadivus TaxID=2728101 RepID=UPI0018849F19|nr:hypothetical protein [Gluconobacter cadivus]MBF0892722.1 hypothetical protein [Gluconobacter cadivus]
MTTVEITKDNPRWTKGTIVSVKSVIAKSLVKANVAKIISSDEGTEGLWVK